MNLIFDTHAQYDDEAFDADREALLSSMPENGVGLIVDPGCDLDTSRRAVEIAEQYPHVYSAVGWHPENCAPYTRESLDTLRAWAKNPKVVAIGEIGLDYYWEQNPPREFQQEVFRDQLALAQELGLPVIVHDRDAHADCLAIVKEFPQVRGVFHCFSGSAETARDYLRMGFYISFAGPLTFKKAPHLWEAAAAVPMDRLLVETDSPYMAPDPLRGRRNEPANVVYTGRFICENLGIDENEFKDIINSNYDRLFGGK